MVSFFPNTSQNESIDTNSFLFYIFWLMISTVQMVGKAVVVVAQNWDRIYALKLDPFPGNGLLNAT